LKAPGKHFREALHRTILKTDWAEICRGAGSLFLREQNDIGSVDALKLNGVVVERLKNGGNSRGGGAPSRYKENCFHLLNDWSRSQLSTSL
jgi:hypothetical protein